MTQVQILSPDVIAKIAAGEVVERPASVVKELVENALDANATSIEINLKDAGKELIHIKDNGTGITKENITKIFNRHATSKIRNIEDLEKLLSMGFRGEALYSIAAVSDVQLRAHAKDSTEAWQIHLRGGIRQSLEPAASQGHGCDIKISEIFFNTPARRKFLKSSMSELNQVVGILTPYTLIYPEIAFKLTHAQKTIIDLKAAPNRKDRMAAALNLKQSDIIETSQDFPKENIYIHALLGNINIQRHRRDNQFLFINNRPVTSKAIDFAVNDVYRSILAPGVYGAFVLDITIDPANVDVNIHPSKREVRINNESKLISMIRHLCEYTLMQFGQARSVGPSTAAALLQSPDSPIFESGIHPSQMIFAPGQMSSRPFLNTSTSHPSQPSPTPQELFDHNNKALASTFGRSRYIGQFNRKFLLFEDGPTLFIVDQHAAQERIMFEKFNNQVNVGTLEIQPLLSPLLININAQERLGLEANAKTLEDFGFNCTLFDEETLAIHSQPLLLKNIELAVRTLLAADTIARIDRNTLARRACKASIVAGDPLNQQQAEFQRKELLACQDPFTCPHGRPTVIEMPESYLDRQFLRS